MSTQHNAQMKIAIHMLVMNNVMHIKAKDNTKKGKDYPLFSLWSLTDDGTRGMVIILSVKLYISNIHTSHSPIWYIVNVLKLFIEINEMININEILCY